MDALYDEYGFGEWRATISELLSSLPSTEIKLSQWILEANEVLKHNSNLSNIQLNIKRNSKKCKYKELSFEKTFGRPKSPSSQSTYYLGTVHSVKGKSLDAVMLVLKKKAGKDSNYVNVIKKDIQMNEELRIVYVAITRTKYLLVIAVPSEDVDKWRQRLNLDNLDK
jgi:superfamily I DNA/RNA helicase